MAIRAAVASTDGKIINCHFGKASKFLIFELVNNSFEYIEIREVKPCCNRGEHEDNAFEIAAKKLSDCSIKIESSMLEKAFIAAAIANTTPGVLIFHSG